MVIEEAAEDDYSSSDRQYTGGDNASTFPASMGPGARRVDSPYQGAIGPNQIQQSQPELSEEGEQSNSSLLQQVQEIRSHYSFEVRDRILFLGYDLHGAARRYSLPFASMPLSGATSWLLYGGPLRTRVTSTFVIDTIRGAENLANRPLSQREAEGYALHASRRTLYSFASSWSALGIGAGMAFWNRKTMKFPFRKPQPLEKYNNFPNRWTPILTGRLAQSMWHITRVNVYVALCLALLAPLYASMGDSAMMVGLYKDSRTHEVTKGMATALKESGGAIKRHTSNKSDAGRAQTTGNEVQNDDGFYASSEQGAANDYGDRSDYSGDTAYTDGSTDTGLLGDSQMQSREARQSSQASFSGNPAFRKKTAHQAERDVDSSSDSDYIFDDASPTGGSGLDRVTGSGGGSAWERLRREQSDTENKRGITPPGMKRPQGPTTKQMQQDGTRDEHQTSADSFSFSSRDEEKQLAKELAQREFDKMLEEERKGADAVAASGNGGAWARRRGK